MCVFGSRFHCRLRLNFDWYRPAELQELGGDLVFQIVDSARQHAMSACHLGEKLNNHGYANFRCLMAADWITLLSMRRRATKPV